VYSWQPVSGADKYRVSLHTTRHQCSATSPTYYEKPDEIAIVEARDRCNDGICSFAIIPGQPIPQGVLLDGLPQFGGYIHCTRDMDGHLVVFSWTVQAMVGSSIGTASDVASYSLK
jgi:hypothetical protein